MSNYERRTATTSETKWHGIRRGNECIRSLLSLSPAFATFLRNGSHFLNMCETVNAIDMRHWKQTKCQLFGPRGERNPLSSCIRFALASLPFVVANENEPFIGCNFRVRKYDHLIASLHADNYTICADYQLHWATIFIEARRLCRAPSRQSNSPRRKVCVHGCEQCNRTAISFARTQNLVGQFNAFMAI